MDVVYIHDVDHAVRMFLRFTAACTQAQNISSHSRKLRYLQLATRSFHAFVRATSREAHTHAHNAKDYLVQTKPLCIHSSEAHTKIERSQTKTVPRANLFALIHPNRKRTHILKYSSLMLQHTTLHYNTIPHNNTIQ